MDSINPPACDPRGTIFVADKPDYYEITDQLPEFDGPEHITSLEPVDAFK